jgi:hypothetical protein
MKKLFLFLALLIFSFHYCNDNILIYKNDLKEIKVNTVVIQKKYNDKIYDLKVSVGENFLGKVTSFSIEVLGNDSSFENVIINSREKIKINLLKIISDSNSSKYAPSIGPVVTVGNCYSNCTKKWGCYDKPTETGTALCTLDCALECVGA